MTKRAFIVALLLTNSSLASAQVEQPAVDSAACQAAISALGATPRPLPTDDVWVTATACGSAGGSALAGAVSSLVAVSDTAQLNAGKARLSAIRDGSIFAAVKSLASNSSATSQARVMAFGVLLAQHDQSIALDKPLGTSLEVAGACIPHADFGGYQSQGSSLPSEYVAQVVTLTNSVAASGAPNNVKNAAKCALRLFRPASGPQIDTSKLSLTYVCGNKFRVNNTNSEGVTLRYVTTDSVDSGSFGSPGGRAVNFVTAVAASVKLYYGNTLIQSKPNGGIACP